MSICRASLSRVAGLAAVIVAAASPGRATAQSVTATPPPPDPAMADPAPVGPAPAWPVPALAPPGAFVPAAAPAPVRKWYGYEIIASDAASILVLVAGQQAAPLGLVGFFAAPAVFHGVHENVPMAVASPLLRLGLAVGGAYAGAALADCSYRSEDDCELRGAFAGLVLGTTIALALDYALAWSTPAAPFVPRPPAAPGPYGVRLSSAGVTPIVNGATFVLGGAF
jgi:hypothetical protein